MRTRTLYAIAAIAALLFVLLIIAVRTVDVAEIGPNKTEIGLSTTNAAFRDDFSVNYVLYYITEWLGVAAVLAAGSFAVLGLYQLIKRKSIKKVDLNILTLGVLFIVTIIIYVFFEKVAVNYRPVILPGETEPEASFPSSHTVLICVVMGSINYQLRHYGYIDNEPLTKLTTKACTLIALFTVIGRAFSGVHWFTDVVGGVLISAALLALYAAVTRTLEKRRRKKRRAARPPVNHSIQSV